MEEPNKRPINILIGVTGSVATIKLPMIIKGLKSLSAKNKLKLAIRVISTQHALHFFNATEIANLKVNKLYTDQDEWNGWKKIGDPVLHIELRKWAHLFLIAPLDANTLAKLAVGLCDNLITCVARAWDLEKPLIFCPAMNTLMWKHPITAENVDKLKTFGYIQVEVACKKLACNDVGPGAMAEVADILSVVWEQVRKLAIV